MRIGLAQLLIEGFEPERNLQRASKMIIEASHKGCQIVVLPETMDFGWTHPVPSNQLQPIPGKYSDFFAKLALQYKIYICVGLTEKRQNQIFNTAIIINPEGEIIHKHSKINLLPVEKDFYQIGQNLGVVNTPLGCLGLNICADNYAEAVDIGCVLGRMGAQIILSPCAWTVEHFITEKNDPYGEKWVKPLSYIAEKNNLFLAACTSVGYMLGGPYSGKKMVGRSLLVGSEGIIAEGAFNEYAGELVIADINLEAGGNNNAGCC